MLRNLFAGAAALMLAACGEPPPPPQPPSETPFLWEVANADGEVEGWLYGTIHALPDGVEWRGDAVSSVVENADLLAVEVANLDDTTALSAAFMEAAQSPGHPPLGQRVAPEDRVAVDMLAAETPYDGDDFRSIETWAAALILGRTLSRQSDSANGVDKALIREFKRSNRPVRELEGAAAQFAAFDGLAEIDQRSILAAVVDESRQQDAAGKAGQLWRSGDVAQLAAETERGLLADPEVREALLVNRNRNWAEKAPELFADERTALIAVGAAHLVGPDGLVKLLEQNGYTVTRLP